MTTRQPWQNWSGSQQHDVLGLLMPETEAALVSLVQQGAAEHRQVRAVGSAHSFVPFWTDDYLVSLDNMKGLAGFDSTRGQATFLAGTKLHEIGGPLWERGLAMVNMGDIDRQSLAGAVSTGTHGTGLDLQNLSSQVVGLRLVTGEGEVLDINADSNADLLPAARVSLGSLGMISQVTLQLMPAYHLQERVWHCDVAACAEAREALMHGNRHWEFFWDPQSDRCEMKTLNMVSGDAATLPDESGVRTGPSYQILPSSREHRFNETEFSVPLEAGWDCFLALRQLMQEDFPEVRWPLEFRTLKADDSWISSASGRDSVTISAHQGANRPHVEFFAAVEAVFRHYEGRPHWGKVHTHSAEELASLLPNFSDFANLRQRLDPQGLFLNPFLRRVFGVD